MDEKKPTMHQSYDPYVTNPMCDLHHQLVESKLEMLKQKDQWLEDKISGVESRLDSMEKKIDDILRWQENQYKLQIGLLVAIVLTLAGVLVGRVVDFGMFA